MKGALLWLIAGALLVPGLAAAGVQAPPPAAPAGPAADAPILWRELRAGMSPQQVQAALRAQGLRAALRTDEATGQAYVDARGRVQLAGRPARMAFGFVDGGLFYVDLGAHRTLDRPVGFASSHFTRVASMLSERFGAPLSSDEAPIVTDRSAFGFVGTATAMFEQGGVRADLEGRTTYSRLGPRVQENVTVRFWRPADAEAFAASRPRSAGKPPS